MGKKKKYSMIMLIFFLFSLSSVLAVRPTALQLINNYKSFLRGEELKKKPVNIIIPKVPQPSN